MLTFGHRPHNRLRGPPVFGQAGQEMDRSFCPTGLALPPTRQCQYLVCCGNNVGWPVKPPDSVLDAMLDLADPWMHKPDAAWSHPVSSDEILFTRGWAVDRVKKLMQETR